MLLDAPESLTDDVTDTPVVESQPTADVPMEQPEMETITVDEANEELQEVANEVQEEAAEVQSNVNEDDRRFWAKIDVIGQITECQASIAESESTIDNYKCEIKEEKELLKGEQIRLQRLAGKLADIVSGKPLPIDPSKEKESKKLGAGEVAIVGIENDEVDDMAWRNVKTRELLQGMSGLGAKKLDALVELAPTAGQLEDLRGEASKAHKSFKEMLPKGCGQTLADAIEDRLMDCVASGSKSAADQLAEQQSIATDSEMLDRGLIEIVEEIAAELQKDYEAGAQADEYKPADPEDKNDWFVLGFDAFGEGNSLNDCPKHDDDFDRDWVMGWLSAQFIDEWDQHVPADKTSSNS